MCARGIGFVTAGSFCVLGTGVSGILCLGMYQHLCLLRDLGICGYECTIFVCV